jgi:hypothetical protein
MDLAEDAAGTDGVADFGRGFEVPLLLVVQAGHVDAALDEVTHLLLQELKGALDSVVDAGEEARAEFDGQGHARVLDRFAGLDARRVLVDLDDRFLTADLDDLAHEAFVADTDDVVHARRDADGGDDGARDAVNGAGLLGGHGLLLLDSQGFGFTSTGRPLGPT